MTCAERAPPRRARFGGARQDVDESDVSSSEEDDGAGARSGPGHYRRQGSIFGEMLRTLSDRFGEDPLDYDSDDEPRVPMAQRAVVGATLRACPCPPPRCEASSPDDTPPPARDCRPRERRRKLAGVLGRA